MNTRHQPLAPRRDRLEEIRLFLRGALPLFAAMLLSLFVIACGSKEEAEVEAEVLSETTEPVGYISGAPLSADGDTRIYTEDSAGEASESGPLSADLALDRAPRLRSRASDAERAPAGRADASKTTSVTRTSVGGSAAPATESLAFAAHSRVEGGGGASESYAYAADIAEISEVPLSPKAKDGVTGEKGLTESDVDDLIIIDDDMLEPEPAPDAGQLTAGEWSDLREWDFWQSVIASNDWKSMSDTWGMGKGTRLSVRVDNGREPIVDAVVTLKDKSGKTLWTARSDNHGRAELFTGLDEAGAPPPYDIVAEAGGKSTTLGNVDPRREQSIGESPLIARLDVDAKDAKLVEVVFAIDATGSMGDELNYIKAELDNVIERASNDLAEQDVEIRLGANVYRDEGDEYLIRSEKMTDNVTAVAEFLRKQYAGGGGDTPEAVEVALEDAIENHAWSDEARSRIVFLVLDAPPHQTPDRLQKIRDLVRKAAEKGIRIIGLSGSGVDKPTEFLMRYLGLHTGGTYTFLTDHSGIGGSHVEPTIGSHEIEYLNDLLVRLIVQYTDRPASIDDINPRLPAID